MRTLNWNSLSPGEKEQALTRPIARTRADLATKVRAIIDEVRAGGDHALHELTARFDRVALDRFEVSRDEWNRAASLIEPAYVQAMRHAARNLESFHRCQLPTDIDCEIEPGIRCERKSRPIARVGLYAPGGTASLPSTVLMLGIPARLAGCPVRVLCTPPRRDGSVDPYILAAASVCGIERVFKLGGAQAIAALAYGTQAVPKVDKIFGPGNAYVTEAKEQVSRDPQGAASDMPAGPSEVLVVADTSARPDFVAADLLSQAEHGEDSQVILVTDSPSLAKTVRFEVEQQLAGLPRAAIATASLAHSLILEVASIDEAIEVANSYAPEHLILQLSDPRRYADRVRNAGSVFLGAWSPESAGDYASGTNHVLPTYGYARATSGLCVNAFLKQITFQELSPDGLRSLGPTIERLAALEGLDAHRRAVSLRLSGLGPTGEKQ